MSSWTTGIRLTTSVFIACLLLTLSACARAETRAVAQSGEPPSPGTLVLTDERGKYPLGLHVEFLEDPSGQLTIDQVSSPAFDEQFTPSQAPVPNYGYTTSVYWARLDLDNQSRQTDEWLLELGYVYIQYVDLYVPFPDGSGFAVKQTGVLRPVSTRDIPFPRILFDLSLPAHSRQTYYLRFENEGSMTLPLTLWEKDTFWVQSQPKQMQDWLFLGAIMALLVYHLFLYVSLRDIRYLYFVILLACMFFHFSTQIGHMQVYIFPGIYQVKPYGVWGASIVYAAIVLFSDAFWELPTRHPGLHRIFIAVLAGWAGLIILGAFTSYYNTVRLVVPYALVSLVITWVPWFASWRKPFAPSRYFVVAWLGMLVSLFLLLVVRLRWLPSTPLTERLYLPGVLLMAVGWSLALADRINQLKAETDTANQNLQQSQIELSQILDGVPLGIVVYGKDQLPKYVNQRAAELLSNPERGILPGLQLRHSLSQAIDYYSLSVAGTNVKYPLAQFPIYRALKGEPSWADDLEADLVDRRVHIELWASPVLDKAGSIQSAVGAFQDITPRKQAEAELEEYRKQLEIMVQERTSELQLHVDWLSAINQMNQILAGSADFVQHYEKIVGMVNDLFASRHSFIAEWAGQDQHLKILEHSCRSDGHPALVGSLITLPESIQSRLGLEQGILGLFSKDQIDALDGPIGLHLQDSNPQSMALVPLRLREHHLGFLGLELGEKGRTITLEEANLLGILSTDIAQLIEDAHLFEQAKLLIATEERQRLARELHDSVTQALYSINLFADATQRALANDRIEVVKKNLSELNLLSREAMADMRLLIFQLRPPDLDEIGLVAALQSRLESVESKAGLQVVFHSEGELQLSREEEDELYWIAQEALNNAIKHALASQVEVQLIGEAGCIRLVIEDNGIGFDPDTARKTGVQGIRNMRERAEKIGARCCIESSPGQGTKVTIEVIP